MFIHLNMVGRFLELARMAPALRDLAMLCLAGYTFLLRVPSEGIPIAAHEFQGAGAPVFRIHADTVELWLPKRKNRMHPVSILRKCWCKTDAATCPVHVLGAYFKELSESAQPFIGMSQGSVLDGIRRMLAAMAVPSAALYRTHDLRRGHAEDMRINGASLGEILRAGDWRSPAFLHYLDAEQLELDRTVEAHLDDSSGEE